MKHLPVFLAAAAFAAPAFADQARIGAPAPDFALQSASGEAVTLAEHRGSTVVLEWTNHDCPFVRKHYDSGNMQALQKEAAENGVVWLTLISSAPGKQGHVTSEQARKLTESRDAAPSAVLFDESGDVGRAYDAKTTPHMYVIDAEGVLRYAGAIDSIPSADKSDIESATNYVRAAFDAMAAGREVETSQTRAYGCSIKYGS